MASYLIVSTEGVEFGTYEADSEEEAYARFVNDAGYESVDSAEGVAPRSVTVTEVLQ